MENKKKSDFQKEIEEQQKRLQELYIKAFKIKLDTKSKDISEDFKELLCH